MWLAVTGRIPRPPVAVMCLFMLLAAHGVSFLNTAAAVRNFLNYSGTIVGIMKVFPSSLDFYVTFVELLIFLFCLKNYDILQFIVK